jgi:hypothetical protein
MFTLTSQKTKTVFSPNPVIDTFKISGINGKVKLIISDLHCRILLTKEIVCDELISMKEIPPGVYVAQLATPDGIERRKLEKR